MKSLLIILSFVQVFLTVVYCKPSVSSYDDSSNSSVNISDLHNLIDISDLFNFGDDDNDEDDEYDGIDTDNINTIEHLQTMGIQTNGIDLDILEDSLISVVSLRLI